MSPDGGDKPTGELAQAIDEFFGGFDKFRAHFPARDMRRAPTDRLASSSYPAWLIAAIVVSAPLERRHNAAMRANAGAMTGGTASSRV